MPRAGERRSQTTFFLALLASVLALVFIPAGCAPTPSAYPSTSPGGSIVRVRLLEGVRQIDVSATDRPIVHLIDGAQYQLNFPPGRNVRLVLNSQGWKIGSAQLIGGELRIDPGTPGSFYVGGLSYRGQLTLIPTSAGDGAFDVINRVDIESYLQGVLPKELLRDWDLNTYKAQAIVARTYALYELRHAPAGRTWDVSDDTRSQMYGGILAETDKSRQAVSETRGQVIVYGPDNAIIPAYFSACCGGVRASARDVFGGPDIPPLAARSVGRCCSISPRFDWGPIVFSKAELTRRFRLYGQHHNLPEKSMADVQRLDIEAANPFGRPTRFVLTDARGVRYSLAAEDLRAAIDSTAQSAFDESANTRAAAAPSAESQYSLPSSFFKPVVGPATISITEGHGYGHGVGFCQWCAQAQAMAGMSAARIVLDAYPGARIVRGGY